MTIANKKSVSKANYIFDIKSSEILEQENFGSFEVIKTKRGIMFKTYTGYHVWTTPYAVGTDGKAHETSLYKCLDELLQTNKLFKGHEDEELTELNGEKGITKGDLLNTEKIVVEANLTRPMTVFTNRDYAYTEAAKHIDWLKEQMELLQKTAEKTPPEDDEKANAEYNASVEAAETMQEMLKEENTDAGEGQ